MRSLKIGCEMVAVVPAMPGFCAVWMGPKFYGYVEGAAEGLYAKACEMIAKAEWAALVDAGFMEREAESAAENREFVIGMIKKGVTDLEGFEHLAAEVAS